MGYWFECKDLNGKYYRSEAEMARAHGVKPSIFNSRKLSGLPLAACLKPCQNSFTEKDRRIKYKDKKYRSLRDCCTKLEVPDTTIYNKVVIKRMPLEKALDMALENKRNYEKNK